MFHTRMARNLAAFLVLLLSVSICEAATIYEPISDSHRAVALELFAPINGSYSSLEDTYEALSIYEILAIENKPDVSTTACQKVLEILGSSSTTPKDVFYALKVNGKLKCKVDEKALKNIASRLKATVSDASTLLDIYYSIGALVLIKDQTSNVDVLLADGDGTFQSIKALSQSDGRWRYSPDNPESSTYAAGLALEAFAGVISLASSEIDQSRIDTAKNDILKLFDSIEKY
ncbi:dolichyl-diphosphooligosaccharide--protein glycosyltransferase subunit 2-like, partial [Neltuma alba]|uniref:dolichyl-diphosphooligosaccharide--protein glycosyltransferase subunit 2-like n=1 Tax=Neltuma alba TaxID=207710 RepID=UPI0010A3A25B